MIKAAAIADDEDNDIFRLATRLKIGFTPVGADMEQCAQLVEQLLLTDLQVRPWR